MKVTFVTNYFNHHQKPFCEELYQRLGSDFTFISTTVMREERRKLGYAQDNPPYVLLCYEGEEQRKKALFLINDADVVIAGGVPSDILKDRIRQNKLLFRYAERPFKKKISYLKKFYHGMKLNKRDMGNKNIYMLCASAYASGDYAGVGLYKNRAYKWGYFPAVNEYDTDSLMSQKKTNTIMWCGRFIDWKHPDDVITLAAKLKSAGYDFLLNIVGGGVMEEELKQLSYDLGVSDRITFLGSMPPEKVRTYMEEAGIYLFTSDRQEGWGAVLNESMNSGCAVVTSHAVGSAPFLVRDGENGFLYESENTEMLFDKVKYLLDHPEEQKRLGRAAYETMTGLWNAKTAASRFLQLSEKLLSGENNPGLFEDGPCSKAEILKDNWFKENKE